MWGFVYILKYRIPKLYFIAILPFCTFVFNLSLICKASSGPACAEQAFTTQPLVPGEHKVGNKQLEVGKVLHLEPVLPLENVSLNNLGGERRENNMGVSWMTWGKGFWNQHCHWKNIFFMHFCCVCHVLRLTKFGWEELKRPICYLVFSMLLWFSGFMYMHM